MTAPAYSALDPEADRAVVTICIRPGGKGWNAMEELLRILVAVSQVTGVDIREIRGRGRRRPVADARMISMALLLERSGLTSAAVGELFERDHSTVLNAANGVTAMCQTDARFRARVEAIRQALKSKPE